MQLNKEKQNNLKKFKIRQETSLKTDEKMSSGI